MGFSKVNFVLAVEPKTDIDKLSTIIDSVGKKLATAENWKEKIITEKEKEKEIQNHINAIKTVKNKINNLINDATATMSDLEKTYAVATVEAIEESFKIITKNVRNP
jgi:seryl-tRNA synthetase